jgi:hypothetical protein
MNDIWKFPDSTDKQFIHFKRVELCDAFKSWYSGSIGHTCCDGLGCLLHNVTDLEQVKEIRTEFLASLSKN